MSNHHAEVNSVTMPTAMVAAKVLDQDQEDPCSSFDVHLGMATERGAEKSLCPM